jgi:hypothetical protein
MMANTVEDSLSLKCKAIFRDLLECQSDATTEKKSAEYLRMLFSTKPCDKLCDLTIVRQAHMCKLNWKDKERLDRILISKESVEDRLVAARVNSYYSQWTQEQLVSTLSGKEWWRYQFHQFKQSFKAAEKTFESGQSIEADLPPLLMIVEDD